uniref:(northern house mosquito) hypothetical protein n=1 Tax=Culex pipiens TaxID=7175 RepID=A0A8D8CNS0_CULPI
MSRTRRLISLFFFFVFFWKLSNYSSFCCIRDICITITLSLGANFAQQELKLSSLSELIGWSQTELVQVLRYLFSCARFTSKFSRCFGIALSRFLHRIQLPLRLVQYKNKRPRTMRLRTLPAPSITQSFCNNSPVPRIRYTNNA